MELGQNTEVPAPFVVNADTYTLRFEDGPAKGAVLTVTPLDVDAVLSMSEVERKEGMSGRVWYDTACKFLLDSLVSWNLHYRTLVRAEDTVNGRIGYGMPDQWVTMPIPMTPDGMRMVTLPQFRAIYTAWIGAVTGNDEDLGKESDDGGTAMEGLPMTGL